MDTDSLNWSIDYYLLHFEECNNKLRSLNSLNDIPIITTENFDQFKDGDMVRYQGMIQDMLNPEYYCDLFSVQDNDKTTEMSGKYRDIALCTSNQGVNINERSHGERMVYYCIPVTGTTKWVRTLLNRSSSVNHAECQGPSKKRSFDADTEETVDNGAGARVKEANANKKVQNAQEMAGGASKSESESGSGSEVYSSDMYFPLHKRDGLPCLVKIYEKEDRCNLVLNDRIEVVGFLSLNPALECTWEDADAEDKAMHPPPSLVPRLHSIYTRKLVHTNPLLDQKFNVDEIKATAEQVRSDLHLILTQILYGDSLAADYIICHMLSRVYSRIENYALGRFSVNLFNIKDKNFGRRLHDVLEMVVTNLQILPLTIQSLNEKPYFSRKDYETNRLVSGRLQLADDTHLIIDETDMSEGKLQNTGCLNMVALHMVVEEQEVSYDFEYYPVKYNTSLPIIVVSEGKSMFQTNVAVKLYPDQKVFDTAEEAFDPTALFLNEEMSQKIRIYLTGMRLQEFDLTEELMRRIGDDYVNIRQQNRKFNSEDLHNLLVLSRLLSLSYGRTQLTVKDWSRAVDMELERRSRL